MEFSRAGRVGIALALIGATAACASATPAAQPVGPTTRSTHSASTSSTQPKPRPNYRAQLARTIAALPDGAASVGVINLSNGKQYLAGERTGIWTASAYKLLLVEILLLQTGGNLSASQQNDAAAALEHSDNVAGFQLYIDVGRADGMTAAFKKFGLRHTVAGWNDPTFTKTGAADCLIMLRALVEPGRLSASSRKFVLSLMSQVEADQRWGVGAAADGEFVNKNGWLDIDNDNPPGERDNGLWVVTSLGIVHRNGQKLLMAVLTQHNRDFDSGKQLVERLAKLAAAAVTS